MTNFSSTYPNIAAWTESYGWTEIGKVMVETNLTNCKHEM
jgi:hypothetical protein